MLMASFDETDIRSWDAVDVESEFQADSALFRDSTCDDLLEFDETFKPLWRVDARQIPACLDPTTDVEVGSNHLGDSPAQNRTDGAGSSSSSPRTNTTSSSRKRWTTEEEAQLIQCMKEHGNKWSKIAAIIQTKNTIQVKTHAHYLLKKNTRAAKGQEPDQNAAADDSGAAREAVRSPKKSSGVKAKAQADVEAEDIIVLKEAEAIETLKNKFPDSEIVSIDKSADEEDDIDIDVDTDCDTRGFDDDDDRSNSVGVSHLEQRPSLADLEMESPASLPKAGREASKHDEVSTKEEPEEQLPVGEESDVPTQEVVVDESSISEEEKSIHAEFFNGISQFKTPERYLKIRNFILEAWANQKPKYLNKTTVRQGLKNCGDVNCIGRIHDYLEQTAAINFGCSQVTYKKKKAPSSSKKTKAAAKRKDPLPEVERPQRKRAASIGALLNVDVKGGGVTVEHNSGGGVISQTLVRSRAKIPKPKQNPFKLIPCRTYDDNQEPFGIHVCVSALLQMDIHSHLLETEVIGLLGGYYDEHRSCLVVSAAEPCDSVSTGLECEMDSVSQTLSMECLMGKGYDVVGWYHSHPTFVPNPSVRDVTTQRDYQAMFSGQGRPFVAAILSPYLPLNAAAPQATIAKSLVTKAKWWVVGDGHHGASVNASSSGSSVPYGFSPKLLKTDTSCIVEVRRRIDDLVKRISGNPARVGLSKAYPWLPPLHYLDKMLTSLQFHLTNSETSVEDAAEILQAVHAAFTER
ncbi:histone H2A deubiquitinase MYSM1 isoform X2 [Ixodes scapularis]|uniref:histone H2A deubiquitinase MYSM1 isoform X2 n=1 Tax=Ixodes scapularis TaxID=6945 RepID=UPI001A9F57B1|nr:histone H2A deubiquitinase MYSM1 isoform X2 [Ixodes scapularis]